MRAIWKGSISFSLINIPIALYPATRREELKFRLLRASDLSPVNYKRVADADGKEVPWDQIVKGYEYEKGKFIVLKDDDFKRADIEATQSVDILDFVELEDIDPIFFDKPYYLEPEKRGEKAYGLLREALKQSGKVGIAKVVIKTRQHLAAVKPEKNLLVLELMHFADELGAQVIIRGLRAVADFEYEFQMTAMNQQLNRELETVFLMADPRHQAIASRLVKEIAQLGGNISPFVAPSVEKRLLDKVKQAQDPANRAAE